MERPSSDLKQIFEFVRQNEWCTARHIGRQVNGGKSRANHYLYGYKDILFEKRGLTPPQWKVTSSDAYEKLLKKFNPEPAPPRQPLPRPRIFPRRTIPVRRLEDLPPISVCPSCDLPIQPTGKCGCS